MIGTYNFQRFSGWRLPVLLAAFLIYTIWFTTIGPFGQLTRLEHYTYLQGRVFYSGKEAVTAVQSLDAEGRRLKFITLACDVIYMVLQTWVFEALIAFGLSARGLMNTSWRWCLMAPMGFLVFDFLEDSFLALVMMTSSELIGSFAGVFTLLKFGFFIPLVVLSLGLGIMGIVTVILRKRKNPEA